MYKSNVRIVISGQFNEQEKLISSIFLIFLFLRNSPFNSKQNVALTSLVEIVPHVFFFLIQILGNSQLKMEVEVPID